MADEASPPAGAVGNRAEAERLLQQGLDHYDREQLEEALNCYQQAIAADPDFALAYNNVGMILIDLEQYEQALEYLYYSIRLQPESGESFSNLGFALRRVGRDLEAATAYAQFLALEPELEEGERIKQWILQVMEAQGLQELPPFQFPEERAAAQAEAAPEAPPEPAPEPEPAPAPAPAAEEPRKIKKMAAWEASAAPQQTLAPLTPTGEYADAPAAAPAAAAPQAPSQRATPVRPLSRVAAQAVQAPAAAPVQAAPAVQPAPQAAPPAPQGGQAEEWIEAALDCFAAGDMDGATERLNQVLQSDPANAEALTGLGKVLVRLEQYDEGIGRLQEALSIDPEDPAAYYVLGFALRATGRESEAADAYDQFLARMPDALDAARMRQWVEQVRGNGAQAPVQESPPAQDEAQEQPATLIQPQEGAGDADAEAQGGPGESGGALFVPKTENDKRFLEAQGMFQDGDLDRSYRICVSVLNDDPGHYRSRALLGRILLRQKQYEQAIEQLEGSLVTEPDYAEALYFLGQAYERAGGRDKAKEAYKRCIEVSPEGPRAERLREWLSGQTAALLKESGEQIQCELCLRYFPEEEVRLHDSKNTCKGCLALIGALPAEEMNASGLPHGHGPDAPPLPSPEAVAEPRRRPRGVLLTGVGAVLVLALLGGAWTFTKLPERLGLRKTVEVAPPPPPPDQNPTPPPPPPDAFDAGKVALEGEAAGRLLPCAAWSFQPRLAGLDKAPAGLKVEYALTQAPEGMTVDAATGAVAWTPRPDNYETLKEGVTLTVELTARGLRGADNEEVFKVSRQWTLSLQFSLQAADPKPLEVETDQRVALAGGDFNGDKLYDFALAAGHFGVGRVKFYFQMQDHSLSVPLPFNTQGQITALAATDLNQDGRTDLAAANLFRGDVSFFLQNAQSQPVEGPRIAVGRGPVALCVQDLDGDKQVEIGVLLGLGRALAIASYQGDGRFTEVKRVAMPAGGPLGWVLPWPSVEAGAGFLAVLPLAEKPLQFVPYSKSGGPGLAVPSGLSGEPLVAGVARMTFNPADGGPDQARLLVLINDKEGEVRVLEERQGQFMADTTRRSVMLGDLALAIRTADFNLDGREDLLVVMPESARIYFQDASGFQPGPRYTGFGRLQAACDIADFNGDKRPDLMLLTEKQEILVLQSEIKEPASAVAAEAKGFPGQEELKTVQLGEPLKSPTHGFEMRAPEGMDTKLDEAPEAPFRAQETGEEPARSRVWINWFEEAPPAVDATREKYKANHEGLEWVGEPVLGSLASAQAARLEFKMKGEDGKLKHSVVYIVDLGKRYAEIVILMDEDLWLARKARYEAVARSFVPPKK
ncbi:MAG: tetratricopeptide repeat protein [Planctomycetes bacterium]|nr:tetratricopeptide repeat protein [Planctomycetota bacterium]